MLLRVRGALVAIAIGFLSACGGGGGGSGSGDEGPKAINHAPQAIAQAAGDVAMEGGQIGATLGGTVRLDAGASTDADNDALSYQWTLTSQPMGGNAPASLTGVKLEWQPNQLGTYVFSLTVTDLQGASNSQSLSVVVNNRAPAAVVTAQFTATPYTAPTRTVPIGAVVALDASGSQTPDGHALTVTYALVQYPITSSASLNTTSNATTSFLADAAGEYRVKVTGTDAMGDSFESTYVYVASDQAPRPVIVTSIADLHDGGGTDVKASLGTDVLLNGSAIDSTWLPVSFTWQMTSRPSGSATTLNGSSGAASGFTPDVLGDYVVTLTAKDMLGAASTYVTTVHVNSILPLANIVATTASSGLTNARTLTVPMGTTLTLDGSGSSDAASGPLTYNWILVSDPNNTWGYLRGVNAKLTETPAIAGTWVYRLRVTNSSGAYSEQDIHINVVNRSLITVVDRSSITVKLGNSAALSAALSSSATGGTLHFQWSVDAKPVASTAALSSSSSAVSFTPDTAGTYVVAVRVDDGLESQIGYVAIKAVAAFSGPVALNFVPKESRYSRGLDKAVMISNSPVPSLRIVDPFNGVVRTVLLPKPTWRLKLSPDGRLAAVMHSDGYSLLDIDTATLLKTASSTLNPETIDVANTGVVWMLTCCSAPSTVYYESFDGRTGLHLDSTLSGPVHSSSSIDTIYADRFNAILGQDSFGWYYTVDPVTGKFQSYGQLQIQVQGQVPLVMSEDETLVFAASGLVYDTASQSPIASLFDTNSQHLQVQSLSYWGPARETFVIAQSPGATDWPASYERFTGAAFIPAADVPLPLVNGAQSYGIQVFHSAVGVPVALVQTGSASKSATSGVSYFLVTP
ncbi:PKD domain-containing protein [Paucibacter sp. R3-3]|uniref:PKD domain-containing protein n=1 Tax=Roseateles agri TaxID=3098619 RepID=A0ABU5DHK3_9BURK|nr:PKD domain-containing protein [Paucibacter sp. R3-3]MDY0745757.1 PKD domain-containing protein [Paucibacter sp. R3-3]